METKITIKGEEFLLKNTTRALLKFEEITEKSVAELNENITDTMALFYCMLYGANRNTFKYTYDEFIDLVDDDQSSLDMFSNFLLSQAKEGMNKKKVMKKV
jgi:hypothetical protein